MSTGISMMLTKVITGVSVLTGLSGFLRIVAVTLGILLVLPTAVHAALPGSVTLVSPADGATNVSTAPVLRWNAVTGAIEYQVEVYRITRAGARVDVLRQQTSGTSLLVRRPFLTSPQRRDLLNRDDLLGVSDNYRWRVRARNAAGWGAWSSSWRFVTNPRNVWSPFDTTVEVVHQGTTNQDIKVALKTWNQEAVNWYVREQNLTHNSIHKWEHELRGSRLAVDFWTSVVSTSFASTLPDNNFYWRGTLGTELDEFDIVTYRPHWLVAGQQYSSQIRFTTAPGRPSNKTVTVESEILDLNVPGQMLSRTWWDTVGTVSIPGWRRFIFP